MAALQFDMSPIQHEFGLTVKCAQPAPAGQNWYVWHPEPIAQQA
jgi:hypothetical protein